MQECGAWSIAAIGLMPKHTQDILNDLKGNTLVSIYTRPHELPKTPQAQLPKTASTAHPQPDRARTSLNYSPVPVVVVGKRSSRAAPGICENLKSFRCEIQSSITNPRH